MHQVPGGRAKLLLMHQLGWVLLLLLLSLRSLHTCHCQLLPISIDRLILTNDDKSRVDYQDRWANNKQHHCRKQPIYYRQESHSFLVLMQKLSGPNCPNWPKLRKQKILYSFEYPWPNVSADSICKMESKTIFRFNISQQIAMISSSYFLRVFSLDNTFQILKFWRSDEDEKGQLGSFFKFS